MATGILVANPFAVILDLEGQGEDGGSVYIGVANQNPVTNPQSVYWDEALTIPASQPLQTVAGYIYHSGSPARPYCADPYSIAVYSAQGSLIFNEPSIGVVPTVTTDIFDTWDDLADADIDSSVTIVTVNRFATGTPTAPRFWEEVSNIGTVLPWQIRSNGDTRRWQIVSGVMSPEVFGAIGDGVANDYTPLLVLSQYINAQTGGSVLCAPARNYYIDEVDTSGVAALAIKFEDLAGLTYDLNGSEINVKGTFDRTSTSINSVLPFWFESCSKVRLLNGTVNQNVSEMTRTGPIITEGFAYCVVARGCQGFVGENLDLIESSVDGIGFLEGADVCRNASLNNVRSLRNSRQGITIAGLIGGKFDNCDFSNTGNSSGTYGNTAPSAGLDVEPDNLAPASLLVDDIVFDTCRFSNNVGGPVVVSNPNAVGSVTFDNCSGVADLVAANAFATKIQAVCLQLNIKGGRWENIDLAIGFAQPTADAERTNGSCIGAQFFGSSPAFRGVFIDGQTVGPNFTIADCGFSFTSPSASTVMTGAAQMVLTGSALNFHNNRISVSAALYNGAGTSNTFFSGLLATMLNNRWTTDLASGSKMYIAQYNEGANQIEASGERFSGRFSVLTSELVPVFGTIALAGPSVRLGSSLASSTQRVASATPTTGDHKQGDVTWNLVAGAGGKAGWETTAAGTPGTQKLFAPIDA